MIGGWVTGVDVSHHQRPDACDWWSAKRSGLDFAIVKLSEGPDYQDPAAAEHLRRIREAGLLTGVYHFARPDNRFREMTTLSRANALAAGEREAAWLLACLHASATSVDLPPAIDLEKYTATKGVSAELRGYFVRGLVSEVRRCWGRSPIIYTGDEYWRYQMPLELAAELRALGCPLWLVSYSAAAEPSHNEKIPTWPWSIWQCSGGRAHAFAPSIPGLPYPIDVNRYRGTLDELRGLAFAPRPDTPELAKRLVNVLAGLLGRTDGRPAA